MNLFDMFGHHICSMRSSDQVLFLDIIDLIHINVHVMTMFCMDTQGRHLFDIVDTKWSRITKMF
jgi:hypothetical protein